MDLTKNCRTERFLNIGLNLCVGCCLCGSCGLAEEPLALSVFGRMDRLMVARALEERSMMVCFLVASEETMEAVCV